MASPVVYKPLQNIKTVNPSFTPSFTPDKPRTPILISYSTAAGAGTYVLYTIPTGYKLFITSAHISSGTAAGIRAVMDYSSSGVNFLQLFGGTDSQNISLSYIPPLEAFPNDQIRLALNGAGSFYCGFSGYLEPISA